MLHNFLLYVYREVADSRGITRNGKMIFVLGKYHTVWRYLRGREVFRTSFAKFQIGTRVIQRNLCESKASLWVDNLRPRFNPRKHYDCRKLSHNRLVVRVTGLPGKKAHMKERRPAKLPFMRISKMAGGSILLRMKKFRELTESFEKQKNWVLDSLEKGQDPLVISLVAHTTKMVAWATCSKIEGETPRYVISIYAGPGSRNAGVVTRILTALALELDRKLPGVEVEADVERGSWWMGFPELRSRKVRSSTSS